MISTVHVLVFLVFLAVVVWGTRIDEDRRHQTRPVLHTTRRRT